jgi:hypothetical protein
LPSHAKFINRTLEFRFTPRLEFFPDLVLIYVDIEAARSVEVLSLYEARWRVERAGWVASLLQRLRLYASGDEVSLSVLA